MFENRIIQDGDLDKQNSRRKKNPSKIKTKNSPQQKQN